MSTDSKRRFALIAVPLLAMLLGLAAFVLTQDRTQAQNFNELTPLQQARSLGEIQLVAHDGSAFSSANLQSRWNLVYFGFTHCPDICPTTLAKLNQIRGLLEERGLSDVLRIILVTVDPDRDDRATLSEYVGYFGDVVGVTGSSDAIESFAARAGVAIRIGAMDADGEYRVDHSPAVVLVTPDAHIAGYFPAVESVDAVTDDLERVIRSNPPAPR